MTPERKDLLVSLREDALADLQRQAPIAFCPYNLCGKRVGFMLTDEVVGFCAPGGGLLAPRVDRPIPDQILRMLVETNQFAHECVLHNAPMLSVQDTHEEDQVEYQYPRHCVRGTGEENLVEMLAWLNDHPLAMKLRKNCINAVIGATRTGGLNLLYDWVNREGIETLVCGGICTDICVAAKVGAMLSARMLILGDGSKLMPTLRDVVVYEPACATFDLPVEEALELGLPATAAHPQDIAHHIGLWTMQAQGAILANKLAWGDRASNAKTLHSGVAR